MSNFCNDLHETIAYCLFKKEELIDGKLNPDIEAAKGEGVMTTFMFHKERLTEKRATVIELIKQLNGTFLKSGGGGWSFLNLCELQSGEHWGEHKDCDALFIIANALGLAEFCMPRDFWSAMPGGLPYLVFNLGE